MPQKLRIGTSGWSYKDWRGLFYPNGLPSAHQLAHYSQFYDTVELNGVFYRLPKPEAVKHWYEVSPKGFVFAYKGSQFLTHNKKLKDPRDPLRLIYQRADLLKEKLGPILFQLPPFWTVNIPRLDAFLKALSRGYDHVLEFRHPSWFTEEVYDVLEKYGASLCLYDMRGVPSPERFTSKLAYLRMHGTQDKYAGDYSTKLLTTWASKIVRWIKAKRDVYVYFNNDRQGNAIKDAAHLKKMLLQV